MREFDCKMCIRIISRVFCLPLKDGPVHNGFRFIMHSPIAVLFVVYSDLP